MNPFQVLSTRVGSDGWMDMNVLTPYGVVSIEFHIDDESIPAFNVSDCLPLDRNVRPKNGDIPYKKLITSLLALAEILAGRDCWGKVEPFELVYKNNFGDKYFRIIAN